MDLWASFRCCAGGSGARPLKRFERHVQTEELGDEPPRTWWVLLTPSLGTRDSIIHPGNRQNYLPRRCMGSKSQRLGSEPSGETAVSNPLLVVPTPKRHRGRHPMTIGVRTARHES